METVRGPQSSWQDSLAKPSDMNNGDIKREKPRQRVRPELFLNISQLLIRPERLFDKRYGSKRQTRKKIKKKKSKWLCNNLKLGTT